MGVSYSKAKWMVSLHISDPGGAGVQWIHSSRCLPGASVICGGRRLPTVRHELQTQHAGHPQPKPVVLEPAALFHPGVLHPAAIFPVGVAVSSVEAGPETAERAKGA